ncbi:Beta-lactamase domain-containing protein [Mycena sanguinolenta]|uniref:Beta-lactamase domain-containing protein n=1 Tax=Mycena sanguinolenta TaxID=230812 RepID=A0A8H7DJE9_9AGAR|nr:Beta-lactamase domain-containing protein [Mycena sanguinolenta]
MRLLFPLAFAQLLCFATALNNGTILTPEIDTFVANILADWNSSAGVAVAVVRQDGQGGWLVETKGYGTAKADGTPVTPDTLFAIGSESKLFDISATGLLISNQSLTPPIDWTTKIGSIIPEWELMDPIASNGSSIIDLMSHKTGMPRHDLSLGISDTALDIIKRMKYLKPSAEFRSKFQYNNLMYTTLSYLPTALLPSKPTFAQYVHDNILEPLGMNSTTYSFQVANATNRLADGFGREGDTSMNPITQPSHSMPFWLQAGGTDGTTVVSGPGGVITSINDFSIWLKMLISNGLNPATNATVIPADVLATVTSGITVWPFTLPYPEVSVGTYGGAQYGSSYRGHDLIEHGGDVQGFHSMVTRFPYEGAGVAILINDDLYYLRDVIRYRIIDELFGLDPVDWNTRQDGLLYQIAVETAEGTAAAVSTPRSANATAPTGGFSSLVGNYSNPGYTSFELCLIVPPPSNASEACTTLVNTLNSSFPAQIDYTVPTLAFTWDRTGQYVKLAHFDGNVFNMTGWTGMPTGNASSPVWAYDAGFTGTQVEFGVSTDGTTGFGFENGLWGAQDCPDPQGNTAEERAEVWFTKA